MGLIHSHGSARKLSLLRISVFGTWAIKLATDPLHLIGELPISIFDPPGVLKLFPTLVWPILLDATALHAFRAIAFLATTLAALGIGIRVSGWAAAFGLVFYQGLLRGFGHMNHAEMPLLYAAMLLPLFPCADSLVLGRTLRTTRADALYAMPVFVITATLCLCYSFVGIHRLVYEAPDVFLSDSILSYTVGMSLRSGSYPWQFGPLIAQSTVFSGLLKLSYPLTTVIEALAPLCLISTRFRVAFVPLMFSFHLTTLLLMNVWFWEFLPLYIVFLDSPEPRRPAA